MCGFVLLGKSLFVVYLMAMWLESPSSSAPHCIIYEDRQSAKFYKLSGGGGVEAGVRGRSFIHELADPLNWYVFDAAGREAVEPLGGTGALTYCVSSPDDRHYKQFVKDNKTHFYLPVWSEEELETARAVCCPTEEECKAEFDPSRTLTTKVVSERYLKWGGLPRFVLSFESEVFLDSELRKALAVVDIDQLTLCITSMDSEAVNSLSRTILHYRIDTTDYIQKSLFLGSDYMARQIFNNEKKDNMARITSFLSSAATHAEVGQIRGQTFEPYAHRTLCLGGTFRARSLEDGRAAQVYVSPMELVEIKTDEDIAHLGAHHLGQPKSKTFVAGDAVSKPNLIFQDTVSEKHTIKVHGVNLIAAQLSGRPLLFCFCVPPDRFTSGWTQKQTYTTVKDAPVAHPPEPSLIQQWVLEIPLSAVGMGSASVSSGSIPLRSLTAASSSADSLDTGSASTRRLAAVQRGSSRARPTSAAAAAAAAAATATPRGRRSNTASARGAPRGKK
jgi:hypothetical protein